MSCKQYGWGTWIRTKEMPDSESGALPLGYTPITERINHTPRLFTLQPFFVFLFLFVS